MSECDIYCYPSSARACMCVSVSHSVCLSACLSLSLSPPSFPLSPLSLLLSFLHQPTNSLSRGVVVACAVKHVSDMAHNEGEAEECISLCVFAPHRVGVGGKDVIQGAEDLVHALHIVVQLVARLLLQPPSPPSERQQVRHRCRVYVKGERERERERERECVCVCVECVNCGVCGVRVCACVCVCV